MYNDLIPYASGERKPSRQDREVAGRARDIYDKARLGALETDAVMALGAHIIEGTARLDAHRRMLAGSNEQLNALLSGIELDTVRQAQNVQRKTFNGFGF